MKDGGLIPTQTVIFNRLYNKDRVRRLMYHL